MEEVSKEHGHRASVSMPSLDATDDFPNNTISTEETESAFVTTNSLVSTASTETIVSSSSNNDVLSADSESFSSGAPVSVDIVQAEIDEGSSQHSTDAEIPTDGILADRSIDESSEELIENTSAEQPLVQEESSEPLIDQSTDNLINETSGNSLVEEDSIEPLIDCASAEAVVETSSTEPSTELTTELTTELSTELATELSTELCTESVTEPSTETLLGEAPGVSQQGEGLEDSQSEEDPSIAIDQFIKKIADEQLSSKRIEERKEEEDKEEDKEVEDVNLGVESEINKQSEEETDGLKDNIELEDNAIEQESTTVNETAEQSAEEPSSLENTLVEEAPSSDNSQINKDEPMEVESNVHSTPTQEFNILGDGATEKESSENTQSEEHVQMESIEEIQKEIDRIPPRKNTNNEGTQKSQESNAQNGITESGGNQNENHTQKSIEQILEDINTPNNEGDISGSKSAEPEGDRLKNASNKDTKEPSIQDSSEVARDPNLIEKSQEEIKKLDVLVCGECHITFYFVQEFMNHKKGKCPQKSTLTGICETEGKPQVWGFVLWKIKHTKDLGDNVPSSWSIYQRWCKLPQADRNAWITAGQSIQFASKIGNARVTEVRPAKQTKQVIVHKVIDKEQPPAPLEFVDSNKENSSGLRTENATSNIIKKGISKPVRLNNDVTILPSTKQSTAVANNEPSQANKAVRTTKVLSAQKEEYVVEKIMAKRFNPRKKTWEYNIKWENFGHDSNTWEPISNLSHCKTMLEQFEEQLKRMKEEKAKQAAQSPKGRGRPSNPKPIKPNSSNFVPIAPKLDATPKISNVVGGVSDDYSGGSGSRPTRSSKQNALSQLKQWCGNISDEDSGGRVGIKRKHESDDSDEDYDEKKIKMEEDSDYSDKEVKPKVTIKKVTSIPKQVPVKNGSTGAQQVLPSNILIPDANGVVRINQKQLPALSSGVYIMSKTAGIIKLDSTTSKVATSGGQTIVKVAPKIGQTQIKIVKKDGNTTKQIIQVSPSKPTITSTPVRVNPSKLNASKFTPKIRKEIKRTPVLTETISKILTPKKPEAPPTHAAPPQDEESDDGLEPLPFPGPEEPIPDLEDNQQAEEFMLDPETGKIAGIEYVDKPVVIKEEPQPVPPTTNDLENMVKLAAAEITNSDSQNSDSQMELDPLFTDTKDVKPTIVQQQIKTEPRALGGQTGVVRKVVKYTSAQGMRSDTSILNKALTQGPGTPRAVITPVKAPTPVQVQRPKVVQQKVLNQMVSRTATPGTTRTVVRHVIGPQRSSTGGNVNVIRKTIAPAPKPKFNLPPQRSITSPLQPTRTYSAMGGIRQQNTSAGSKVQVYSTKSSAGSQAGATQQGIRKIGNTIVRTSSSGNISTVEKQHPSQYTTTQKQPITRIVQRVVTSPKKPENQNVTNRPLSQPSQKVSQNVKPKAVINMPSLTDEDTLNVSSSKLVQKPQTVAPTPKPMPQLTKPAVKQEPVTKVEVDTPDEASVQSETGEGVSSGEQVTDWSSFTMADGENPIYVTGDDGTIYQVAGQNEQGQTILITQGPDGQQQCLLVTNEIGEMTSEEQPSTSSANTNADTEMANSEELTLMTQEFKTEAELATSLADSIQTPLHIKTDTSEMEGIEEGMQDQVVAQVVRAEPPSPGGTHKVVVMLPDGNLMVTQVSPEEYASLELE